MIRPAVCRTAVIKEGRKTTSGALPPSPTTSATRKRNSRLVPKAFGKTAGAAPVRVAIIGHEEESNPRRLGRRDTRGSTGVPDQFQTPRSSNTQNAELLTRRLQVEVLPGRPITFHRGITVVHRPVKARGRGANPRDGAIGVQVDISWRHSSRKRDPVNPEAGALPADSANFVSFRSSRAERSVDNRQITERYRAEGPILWLDSSRRRALV